jgi:hypothetical protein
LFDFVPEFFVQIALHKNEKGDVLVLPARQFFLNLIEEDIDCFRAFFWIPAIGYLFGETFMQAMITLTFT